MISGEVSNLASPGEKIFSVLIMENGNSSRDGARCSPEIVVEFIVPREIEIFDWFARFGSAR